MGIQVKNYKKKRTDYVNILISHQGTAAGMGVIVRVYSDGETAVVAIAVICLNPADLRLPIIVVLSLRGSLCRSGCLS